jgi:gliding motility-associated lipoprotein GldH|tara:strand:+ start:1647 stop:2123 length:477 start_codon:yes stop_codon:yes gene_type:complete
MRSILIFLILSCIVSCESNPVYIKYNSLSRGWLKDSVQNFSFQNQDKLILTDSYLILRVNEKYRYNNIFVIITVTNLSGIISKDTIEYQVADNYGKFIGSKMINIHELSLPHKKGIQLMPKENYLIKVEHAMRNASETAGVKRLEGVLDVGYKFEKEK